VSDRSPRLFHPHPGRPKNPVYSFPFNLSRKKTGDIPDMNEAGFY
jgi:hypothetical protein